MKIHFFRRQLTRLLIGLLLLFLGGCKQEDKVWKEIINEYSEIEQIRNENFSKLRFVAFPKIFADSMTFKFLVSDQYNRLWLFKHARQQVDGAVLQYRIYSLLGLYTPEIHPFSFVVNGKKIDGSLQLFQKNIGPLINYRLRELPPQGVFDVAQNHIMSWATLNNHVHQRQFLVLGPDTEHPHRVIRIDNTVEWFSLGQDSLTIDYRVPWLWEMGSVGFADFWRSYLDKDFPLDLTKLHRFARIIESMPDSYFLGFFDEGMKNNFDRFSNVARKTMEKYAKDVMAQASQEKFPKEILDRKNNLGKDFSNFYSFIAKVGGEKFIPDTESLVPALQERLSELKTEKAKLLEEKQKLQGQSLPSQADLEIYGSLEAHSIIVDTYLFPQFVTREEMHERLTHAQSSLRDLIPKAQNEKEKKYIIAALAEITDSIDKKIYLMDWNSVRLRAINSNKNIISRIKE